MAEMVSVLGVLLTNVYTQDFGGERLKKEGGILFFYDFRREINSKIWISHRQSLSHAICGWSEERVLNSGNDFGKVLWSGYCFHWPV